MPERARRPHRRGPESLSVAHSGRGASDHLPIVGPSAAAAELESSKALRRTQARHGVPTARFRICDSADSALAAIASGEFGYPVVIKADGLAAGKGVVIAEDRPAADAAIRMVMIDRRFGVSGERVVLEEFLAGQEASYFVLADGTAFMSLSSAQDHKRIFDDDRGPNTGGMGAFAPSPLVTADVELVTDEIVRPSSTGAARRKDYCGSGCRLMLTGRSQGDRVQCALCPRRVGSQARRRSSWLLVPRRQACSRHERRDSERAARGFVLAAAAIPMRQRPKGEYPSTRPGGKRAGISSGTTRQVGGS